ncbi:Oidioi.mRNA.OKI2018_I69.PAR.g9048.t1.cds [Oikopleura dioica]|uniref:Oidioi.mRNA.OKI2018_I69.PAR.g9048.t1.cds n=1 Tax=Oikopleura dioica TaxID=34765 RepID=A0ABN7RIR5_OIKDI|nr:Oidioi.mRNA.OKI2018_I69.PAR.g9048.t1.cds [Oikopleura dioica]
MIALNFLKIEKLSSENLNLRNLEDLPDKLRTAQARVRNTTAENSHLRNKLEQIENTVDSDQRKTRGSKEKIDRLQKDLEQKKLLIEEQRSRIKNLEKERQDHRKKIESLEEKLDDQTSSLCQNKRTSQNLRRHAQDIKMEKEAVSLELHNLRKKVEELEVQEAKMKIDMNRKEREFQAKKEQLQAANEDMAESNDKALQLLRDRLNEINGTKSELVNTVNLLAKELFARVGRQKASRQSSHTGVQSKVCEILDISASEFGNLMTDKGDQSWLQSIRDVLDAGAPFADTIANSFKYQLDELTRASAPVSGR